jgi:hypothetical protein
MLTAIPLVAMIFFIASVPCARVAATPCSARMKRQNAALQATAARAPNSLAGDDLSLAFALYGAGIFAWGPMADLRQTLAPPREGGSGCGGAAVAEAVAAAWGKWLRWWWGGCGVGLRRVWWWIVKPRRTCGETALAVATACRAVLITPTRRTARARRWLCRSRKASANFRERWPMRKWMWLFLILAGVAFPIVVAATNPSAAAAGRSSRR